MCDTRLFDSVGLVCDNPLPHVPHHGCTFTASSQPDAHDADDTRQEGGSR